MKSSTVLYQGDIILSEMVDNGTQVVGIVDQIDTLGFAALCLFVRSNDPDSPILNTNGQIALGTDLMQSGETGNRSIIYPMLWAIAPASGRHKIVPFIWNDNTYTMDGSTVLTVTGFPPYVNKTGTVNALEVDKNVPAAYIPKLVDLVFSQPNTQTEIDFGVTLMGYNPGSTG